MTSPPWPSIQVAWKPPKDTGYALHECPVCAAFVYGPAGQEAHEKWHQEAGR